MNTEPLTKKFADILVAERAASIDRIAREGALVQRLVKKRQDGTLAQTTEEPMDKVLEDDMAIVVGDTTINHHYSQPHPEPEPVQTQPQPASEPQPQVRIQTDPQPIIPTWFLVAITSCIVAATLGLLWWMIFGTSPPTGDPHYFDITVP